MRRKPLTYEQAHAYIHGEESFDAVEYEKNHVLSLVEVCKEQREKAHSEEFKKNFRHTVRHWIDLHKNCEVVKLLEEEYERI